MILPMLRAIAPDLTGFDDTEAGVFITLAAQRISAQVFGPLYKQAVVYLAAHLATVAARAQVAAGVGAAGAAGGVASISTGGLSVSFGSGGMLTASHGGGGDDALKTTAYGLEFLAIRSSCVGTRGFLVKP